MVGDLRPPLSLLPPATQINPENPWKPTVSDLFLARAKYISTSYSARPRGSVVSRAHPLARICAEGRAREGHSLAEARARGSQFI
jgi:hypothetical protein